MEIVFLFSVSAASVAFSSANTGCNSKTGPAGTRGCELILRNPGRKQWANCLSDKYIRRRSGGRHFCEVPYVIHSFVKPPQFCWYQCMAEMHDSFSGPVTDDCACDGDEKFENDTLPSKCYSPDGSDCSWYSECLEQKHRCSGTPHGYAVEYANKYCNLYGDNMERFSEKGRRWIDAVRKCLQVALVPTVRQYYKGDCADIKRTAFRSHDKCYLNPAPGEPSVCDLKSTDWANSFWVVKGTLVSKDWYRSLWEMIKVGGTCRGSELAASLSVLTLGNPMVSLAFKMISKAIAARREKALRGKRETEDEKDSDRKWDVVSKTTEAVAKKMRWDDKTLDWFGFVEKSDVDFSNVTVNIWLRSLVNDSLSDEVSKIEKWMASGRDRLAVNVDGFEFESTSVRTCGDNVCKNVLKTTEYRERSAASTRIAYVVVVFCLVSLVI